MMASLSQRVIKLPGLAQSFHLNRRMKLIQFQQLLGMITAAATVIPLGLLRAHPLQRWVNSANLHPKLDRHVRMRVARRRIPDVTPLEEQEVTITRGSFREHPSEVVCDDNRCLSDWMGVVWEGRSVRGLWEPPWTLEHINVLELRQFNSL